MTPAHRPIDFGVPVPTGVEVETSARDYTPPQYLTLLLTDLGVLTPSVVSMACNILQLNPGFVLSVFTMV
jgi:translation initiation factor eIF-2B subunit alpha